MNFLINCAAEKGMDQLEKTILGIHNINTKATVVHKK